MKKAILTALVLGIGCVSAAHAVVISWAAETTSLPTFTSAQLVYVSTGIWGNPYEVIDTASAGYPIQSGNVLERDAEDNEDRTTDVNGAYFVVLFDNTGARYRSWGYLLANNDATWNAITSDIWNPASGTFTPTGPQSDFPIGGAVPGAEGWQVIPEPSTFALLAVGAAAIVWKRRRKS